MNILSVLIAKLSSPRTLLAIALSSGVTGVVAGPLTYEAVQARNAAAEVTEHGGASGRGESPQDRGTDDGGPDTAEPGASTTTIPPDSTVVPPTEGGGPATTIPVSPPIDPRQPSTPGGPVVPPVVPDPDRPPTSLAPRPPAVLVSVSADHSGSNPMDGTQLSGQVYIFTSEPADDVQFMIDGTPVGDALEPLDTLDLTVGPHTLTVTATVDGVSTTDTITFTVAR